jgi:hypothetical protein
MNEWSFSSWPPVKQGLTLSLALTLSLVLTLP